MRRGQEEGATLWQPSWSCPRDGCFFPPTLFTDVSPAATIAQVEIFGPVVVLMTFRTPAEAVELANNTRYGLAASVWTENINLALDIAPQLKAGTVWINCTNVFDAASGFGGYRESGFGREGGREGLWEYVKWADGRSGGRTVGTVATPGARRTGEPRGSATARPPVRRTALPPIDRTPKLYIGGKQARPDSGYSLPVLDARRTAHRARWATATARTSGTRSRRRTRRRGGHEPRRTTGPRCSTTSPRISRRAPANSPAARALTGDVRGGDEVELADRAHLHLGRVGGQVRRRWSTTRPTATSRSRCPSRSA